MSKQCITNPRSKSQEKSQPAILRRKRKTECDSEMEGDSSTSCASTSYSDDSPMSERKRLKQNNGEKSPSKMMTVLTLSQFRGLISVPTPKSCLSRKSPLPRFSWAESNDVWENMVRKDALYIRDHTMLSRHPALQAKMRAILLDWLIEVCEVYRLHRETYYLAQDFIDRYLATQINVPKQQLQLLGITSLFVASKIEEIYPPKLSDFAYVTDGACAEDEILEKELVILKVLNWDLMPMTVNSWLSIYLQLASSSKTDDSFLIPDLSAHTFVQIAQLLDLCMLDIGCLQFPYSVVAASAVCHMLSEHVATSVAGVKWIEIAPCVKWMTSFATTLRENGGAELKYFSRVSPDDMHNIQTRTVDLQLLEKAQTRLTQFLPVVSGSPSATIGILTPPQSSEKVPGVKRQESEFLP